VVGIGLSAPLFLHQWADVMGGQAAAALARWESVDLRARVQALTDLPVEFAKDTTAACVAELVQGTGRDLPNFLYVYIGTFIGGGLVLDGHIVNGPRGNAGAIGSMPFANGQAHATKQLLELASGWQLEQALMAAGLDPLLVGHDDIMQEAYTAYTQPWLAQAAKSLALAITSASALLDLDAVVVDGSISPALLQALMSQTQGALSLVRFDGIHTPTLVAGRVGSMARALGGALLPLHAQFFPDKDIFLKQDLL
jgi:predicted NBD/HSP70 family sugar kinase